MEMRKIAKRTRNPLRRSADFLSSLRAVAKQGFQFYVLEESIKAQALVSARELEGVLKVFPHPVPMRRAQAVSLPSPPVKLGFLGLATPRKGFDVYCRLARATEEQNNLEMHVIGKSDEPEGSWDSYKFASGPYTQYISAKEYVERIESVHFVCIFLDPHRYRWTASGTLLDAISFGKPIIGTKIPIVEELFAEYGDIGYTYESESDLITLARSLASGFDPAKYEAQVGNIREIAADRSPAALCDTFRKDFFNMAKK